MGVFDGHNDLLLRLWQKNSAAAVSEFIDGESEGQLDLPRMHDGGFIGGLFAIYVPSHVDSGILHKSLNPPAYPAVSFADAQKPAWDMVDVFDKLVHEVPGKGFRHCLSVADIRNAEADGAIAAVLHMEGAETIGADLSGLDELYSRGLRSLGLVWSRPNQFGHGVPFAWPSSPDTGPGLSDAGKALVKACNTKRIVIDLSHLNEKGFWDVARLSTAPLVASHSNAHALTPSSRNLTDDQLRAIGKNRGIVGLNFAIDFLQNDGRLVENIAPSVMISHLRHMIEIAGEDCVGIGSDFDGATIPEFISDVAGLPLLVDAMTNAGFGKELIAKISRENWLRVLKETWGN
ncbi:MAG: dipeptidase [Aestuariivirga sp.]